MKVQLDATPRGAPQTKKQFEDWSRAVGIQTVNRLENGVTHYVTAYPGSFKASLARQAGAQIITFNAYLAIIRERASEPNAIQRRPQQRQVVLPPNPAIVVQQVSPPPPPPPAAPPAPSRAANTIDTGKRALFLDDF